MVGISKDSIKCPVCDFDVAIDANGKIVNHVAGTEECSASGELPDEVTEEPEEEKKEDISSEKKITIAETQKDKKGKK
ncbi:hypothetical protein L0244_30450 [bacterium]|nr:hypothetical protein [bacterium]